MAAGGQGAPLAPAFHAAAFAANSPAAILNLGGIANLSVLDRDRAVLGFDTGPANCLLDAWISRHRDLPADVDGAWARSGTLDPALLESLLGDPYFAALPPKSSGREYFNLEWLDGHLGGRDVVAANVQSTLLALSAQTVAAAVRARAGGVEDVLACGGGVHNRALMEAIAKALGPIPLGSTADAGVDPDFVEAALFAWLARERLSGRPGNRPDVTGARGLRLLGAIHAAPG
jgi:anhydro-N-acetylmuramic acid kinase